MTKENADNEDKTEAAEQALDAKTDEIRELIAAKLGLGPVSQMSEDDRKTFNDEVDDLIDDHDDALAEGDTVTEWQIRDRTIAQSDLGRLLIERHELEEKYLYLDDDDDEE